MIINIHAGHNAKGKVACGATDFIDESEEARKVVRETKKKLEEHNIKVYDCTVWCTNLNGNPNRQLFRANGGISAKSPKEAELKFKAFLSDKFASVRIEERTITIKEMTPNKEYL